MTHAAVMVARLMHRISPGHSRYFDAWRGGSALAVAVVHAVGMYVPHPSRLWDLLGGAAVMAFFCLSGFFIGKSLEKDGWRRFAAARVNRLLPPFLFCMALVLCLWAIAPLLFVTGSREIASGLSRPSFSLEGFWPTLLMVNGFGGPTLSANGPLWSLSYEVWYYIVAALVMFRKPIWGAAIGVVLTVLHPIWAMLGGLWVAALWFSTEHDRPVPAILRLPLWIGPALTAGAALLAPASASRLTLLAFELAFGVWMLSHMLRVLRGAAPTVPVLPRAAPFSYTLYVTHFPIMLFLSGCGAPLPVALSAALLFAAVVGTSLERMTLLPRREMSVRS